MVKKAEISTNIYAKLVELASKTDLELFDLMPEILDEIAHESGADYAFISNSSQTEMYSSANLDLQGAEAQNLISQKEFGQGFFASPINGWGRLIAKNPQNIENKEFWTFISNLIYVLVRAEDIKNKTRLIVALTSEIRNNIKPEVAIEKICKELVPFLNLQEFYFFTTREEGDGFGVFQQYQENREEPKLPKVVSYNQIDTFDFIDPDLNILSFECKVRDRLWGLLVVARRPEWTEDEASVVRPFAEQMATVFNQFELQSESLSMAQREFLLNQITTTIRESLEVETIVKIATQEIAQVLGVEACGITILDPKVRTSLNHAVWTPNDESTRKMTALIKRSINSEYAPNLDNPMVEVATFKDKKDSLATFFSDLLGVKSYMASALKRQDTGELLGILSMALFDAKRSWTEDEKQLIESIATQLEMALTQAAIYQESQQTKMQMALLQKLSSDIRESLEISKVLEQIAKGLGEVLGLSRCFVRRFTDENRILKTEKEYTAEGFFPSADIIFDFEEQWIDDLADGNIGKDEYQFLNIPYVKAKMMAENSPLLNVADAIDLKSYLCVPLIARDKILGTINVHQCDRERNFLEEEINFVCRVASEATVAIEHAQLFATIERMSRTDADTGLFNKRFFHELALEAIERAKKNNEAISYILLDLDHLKDINDTPDVGGHEAGDEAILLVSKAIENTVRTAPKDEVRTRSADIVARFGGDEFMILLPDTSIEEAVSVAKRIKKNINKLKHSTWNKPLSASIGVAGTPHDDCDFETLKVKADEALYLSKEKGRDCISSSLDLEK